MSQIFWSRVLVLGGTALIVILTFTFSVRRLAEVPETPPQNMTHVTHEPTPIYVDAHGAVTDVPPLRPRREWDRRYDLACKIGETPFRWGR